MTSDQLRSQSQMDGNEREHLAGIDVDRGSALGTGSLRLGNWGGDAERLIPNSPVLADITEMTGQRNQRADRGSFPPSVDRGAEWEAGHALSSGATIRTPTQDATTAAADEVERLRAAVSRTIEQLERVRGSIAPPLPALPPNRGAFRIS